MLKSAFHLMRCRFQTPAAKTWVFKQPTRYSQYMRGRTSGCWIVDPSLCDVQIVRKCDVRFIAEWKCFCPTVVPGAICVFE